MSLELVRKLAEDHPKIASLYLECIKDEYTASMDDVRLVLSSLPKDFLPEDIITLYLFAQKQKLDPDYEISQELEKIILPEPNIKGFTLLYNHNISSLISPSTQPQEEEWMSQYSNALLFKEQISKTKQDFLKKYEDKQRELQKEAEEKQKMLKSFVTHSQNAHSSGVEKAADESFAQLKRTYPQCDIAANIKEIEKFIANLPKNAVTKKNIALARSLLRVIKNNSNFSGARDRLAHVWEAIKDTSKLGDRGETVTNMAQFQQNLRESVITQLASIETNYSVEGKSYRGAGRSCSGGTQNAIIQILDGYHQDVSINYSFRGENQAPILNKDLAKDIYQEIFLEKLSKINHRDREAIIRSWDPLTSTLNQVQLSEAHRLILLQISIETEKTILAKYNTSQSTWFGEVKRNIEQSASLTSVALLKPDFDLLYEYKEIIRSKKFSYDETIEAIKGGGDLKFLSELMKKIKAKNLAFSEEVVKELIPTIKQKDLDSLREEILKSEYKSIDSTFNKLSAKKRIDAVLYPEKFLTPLLKKKSTTLATDLTKRFIQNAETKFDPILITKFNNREEKDKVAKAIFDGSITNLEKADLNLLFHIYQYRRNQLHTELETLQTLENNHENSFKKAEIARQLEYTDTIIGKRYFERALILLQKNMMGNLTNLLDNAQAYYPEMFKIILNEANNDQDTLIHIALLRGFRDLAKELITKKGLDLNLQNSRGYTPLHLALVDGNIELAETLLAMKGVNPNLEDNKGYTPLHIALERGYGIFAERLIEKEGVNLNLQNYERSTPLHLAIFFKDITLVNKLIEKGSVNLNLQNIHGNTPLHLAIDRGLTGVAAKLIENEKTNLNIKNNDGKTPLQIALEKGYTELVKTLEKGYTELVKTLIAKEGIDLNLQNVHNNTLLHDAFLNRSPNIAALIIEKNDINLNLQNNDGNTQLHLAIWYNYLDLAKILIEKSSVNLNLQNIHGNTPLHLAIDRGLTDVAAKLIENEKINLNIKNNDDKTPLQIALEKGYTELVKTLIAKEGIDLNLQNANNNTPLHDAFSRRLPNLAAIIIEKNGVNLNLQNNDSYTPLHLAILYKDIDLAKKLIEKNGVNLNLQNIYGYTPLHIALDGGSTDVAAKLIDDERINLNIKNNKGKTPLHIALEKGHTELAATLIAKEGVDLNLTDKEGKTPLHIALEKGYKNVATTLITKEGIDLNLKNNDGKTPLHIALEKGYSDIAKILIGKEGINLNLQDKVGRTPLHIALEKGYSDIAKILIAKEGINLNLPNREGKTPLHIAIEKGYTELAKALMEKGGVDLNLETKEVKTPLHIAIETGLTHLVKPLIKTGADPNKTDKRGKLPKGFRTNKEKVRFFKEAIKDGDIELVKKLATNYKKLGTSYLSNLSGKTLVSYAIKHKQPEITVYLLEAGFIPKKSWGEFFAKIFTPKKAKELYSLDKKLDKESLDLLTAMRQAKIIPQATSELRTSISRSSRNSRHSIDNPLTHQ